VRPDLRRSRAPGTTSPTASCRSSRPGRSSSSATSTCLRATSLGAGDRPHARLDAGAAWRRATGSDPVLGPDESHPLQVRYPAWSTRFCSDPDQARRTRVEFFQQHADSGRLVFPTHFPTPTGGTIVRDGAGHGFVLDGERCSVLAHHLLTTDAVSDQSGLARRQALRRAGVTNRLDRSANCA
jgi:hypothetical protein